MENDDIVIKLMEHDAHVDALSKAVESVAISATSTNVKLDKVIDALTVQNLIIEKVDNLAENSKDSMKRVHHRVSDNESDIKDMKKIIDNVPTATTIRWAIGILLTYLVLSGNYIVKHIHDLESSTKTHFESNTITYQHMLDRVEKLEDNTHKPGEHK